MGTYYDIHGVVLIGSRVGTATSSLDVGANLAGVTFGANYENYHNKTNLSKFVVIRLLIQLF